MKVSLSIVPDAGDRCQQGEEQKKMHDSVREEISSRMNQAKALASEDKHQTKTFNITTVGG